MEISAVVFEQPAGRFCKTEDKSFRNRLFIQILAPLALLVNERITLERYPLLLMRERLDKGEKLTAENKKSWSGWRKSTTFLPG